MSKLLSTVFLVSLPLLTACTGMGAKIDIGYMSVEPSGNIALENGTATGGPAKSSNNDINDDLGIADQLDSPYLRAEVDFGLLYLTGSGFSVQDKAMGQLNAALGAIPVNTPVETDMDMQVYKLALSFDIIDTGGVRISPGVAADIIDSGTSITATTFAQQETLDFTVPLPMLFLQGEVDLGVVEFVVDLGWLDVDYGEVQQDLLDVEALLRVKPLGPLDLFIGYRAVILDVAGESEGDSARVDLDFKGWMAGVGLYF